MEPRTYIASSDLLKLSFLLARRAQELRPRITHVTGIWRGGTTPGICVHEYIEKLGAERIGHFPVQTNGYKGIGSGNIGKVEVRGIDAFARVPKGSHVLLVDDVWDTGTSIQAIYDKVEREDIMISTGVVFFKPGKNKARSTPSVYVLENDEWLVFPHELEDVSPTDVVEKEMPKILVPLEDMLYKNIRSLRHDLGHTRSLGTWWFERYQ